MFSPHPSVCLNTHCKSSLSLAILINKCGEKFEELDWSAENITPILAEMLVHLFWSCTRLLRDVMTFFVCFVHRQRVVVVGGLNPKPNSFFFAILPIWAGCLMAFVVPGDHKQCLRKIRLYLYKVTGEWWTDKTFKYHVLLDKDKSDLTTFTFCNICLRFVNFSRCDQVYVAIPL